ncbi:hypothetical protein PPNSA23_46790 [Phyllobacterium phragmitis]|uniref:Uncharacterized protein n=1 Tax=Phyllobacterium phragmitis TaxID=2670329 RepID=A0ABQ0H733_9HYPH
MQAVSTGTRFVAKGRPGTRCCKPFRQPQDGIGTVFDNPVKADLSVPAIFRCCDGYSVGMNIKTDVNYSLHDIFPFRPVGFDKENLAALPPQIAHMV